MSRIFLALTTWWCFMKTKDKDDTWGFVLKIAVARSSV